MPLYLLQGCGCWAPEGKLPEGPYGSHWTIVRAPSVVEALDGKGAVLGEAEARFALSLRPCVLCGSSSALDQLESCWKCTRNETTE